MVTRKPLVPFDVSFAEAVHRIIHTPEAQQPEIAATVHSMMVNPADLPYLHSPVEADAKVADDWDQLYRRVEEVAKQSPGAVADLIDDYTAYLDNQHRHARAVLDEHRDWLAGTKPGEVRERRWHRLEDTYSKLRDEEGKSSLGPWITHQDSPSLTQVKTHETTLGFHSAAIQRTRDLSADRKQGLSVGD